MVSETMRSSTQIGTVSIDCALMRITPSPPSAVPATTTLSYPARTVNATPASTPRVAPDDPQHEQVAEEARALPRRAGDGDLAAGDRCQARIGDACDDAEHRAHRRILSELVDAEIAEEQHRRGETEGRADPEPDAADETTAHDAPTRLGGAEEIERRLVRAGDDLRYPCAPRT